MKIFFTFIGDNDCRLPEKGAIISILEQRKFDKVYLFYNHNRYLKHCHEIQRYCENHFPRLKIAFQEAPAMNPTDYNTVYPAMCKAVKAVLKKHRKAEYVISMTSGTPTMHACWIFLQQGGVIDAKLIQVSREAVISEVSFVLDDFPKIQRVSEMKVEMTRQKREIENLKSLLHLKHDNIIGESPEILKLKQEIQRFADTDIPIFIHGETGTGKELVAKAIHYNSSRKENLLIPVNCGSISKELFESEFFGHKKGAFTSAVSDKMGIFKLADGGTIFLDEVGDLPKNIQVKLLRVLDSGTFTPVGGTDEEKTDVRIISATNKDIHKMVRNGDFREDLFYRLMVMEISLPPLRERGNDSVLIAQHFVDEFNQKDRKEKVLNRSAIDLILKNPWEGNMRQLKNAIMSAFVDPGDEIKAEHIKISEIGGVINSIVIPNEGIDFDNEIVPQYYEAALKKTKRNAEQAAKLLGIKPHTFRERLKALKRKDIDITK